MSPSDFDISLCTDSDENFNDFKDFTDSVLYENSTENENENENENEIKNSKKLKNLKNLKTSKNSKNSNNFSDGNFRISNRTADYGNQLFSIHFCDLNLEFYRKHYGGGNGIELSTKKIVIAKLGWVLSRNRRSLSPTLSRTRFEIVGSPFLRNFPSGSIALR